MPTILDRDLYERVKKEADKVYTKPSAYKSGYIVKKYKELGGRYANDDKPKNLQRWFKENWTDIGQQDYPVYRPTKRVTKETPLTASEIDPEQAKEQIKLKQKIKGESNLPPFIPAVSKEEEMLKYSNPVIVRQLGDKYLGKDTPIYYSSRADKKYMVQSPEGKFIHFGQYGMEDWTRHRNEQRRQAFRTRNKRWANSPKWSASFLSYHLLW